MRMVGIATTKTQSLPRRTIQAVPSPQPMESLQKIALAHKTQTPLTSSKEPLSSMQEGLKEAMEEATQSLQG